MEWEGAVNSKRGQKYLLVIATDHNFLQEDLNTLEQWQNDWQLCFNVKKCFTMRITYARNLKVFNYKLGDHILEEVSNACTKPIKQTAYMSLVRPLVEYSTSVWDPHQKDLISKIELIQKRAARFTTNTYNRTTSITHLIKDLN